MLNTIHYYRNVNQSYNEISPPPETMAIVKKNLQTKCWRGCEGKGILLHCWWECKLVQPLWKQHGHSLKNYKRNYYMTQ